MKITTIGGATQDIFIEQQACSGALYTTIDEHSFLLLEEGKKHEVDLITYYTGGGATNSAVSFSRLGLDVNAFFKIGTDPQADFILHELAHYPINLDSIARSTDTATPVSFIIPCPSGESIILAHRGASATVHEQELPFDAIQQSDVVYITSLSGPSASLLPIITRQAKKHDVLVATNPGSSQLKKGADHLRQALKDIDILVLNSYEASLLMTTLITTETTITKNIDHTKMLPSGSPSLLAGPTNHRDICFNIRHYFKEILSHGPRIAVVTNGAEGVYVAQNDTIIFHPSVSQKIVSTVGAGDAFSSCFVACFLQGKNIEEATIAGSINSACVLSHFGAKTGLLTMATLEKKIATQKNLIQKFAL